MADAPDPPRDRTRAVMIAIACGIVLLLAGIVAFVVVKLDRGDLGYVKSHASITWPAQLTDVETFGSGDASTIVFGRVGDVNGFLAANDFRDETAIEALEPYVGVLRPEHRGLPAASTARGASGSSGDTRWIAAIDPRDGRFWVVVIRPDAAGDAPH